MNEFFTDDYYINERFSDAVTPDADKSIHNLALGKKYIIRSVAPISYGLRSEYSNSQAQSGKLTDGVTDKEGNIWAPAYFHIATGLARQIVIDLGSVCAVNGFSIGFGISTQSGITTPSRITMSLSDDGIRWQTVYNDDPVQDKKECIFRYKADFGGRFYAARYVKLTLYVLSFLWMDEIEITGTGDASGALALTDDETPLNMPGRFPSPETLDNYKNILLVLNYPGIHNGSGESYEWKKEHFLPLIAYHDKDNNVKDTFFDVFQFLPRDMLSAGGAYVADNSSRRYTMKDWLGYYSNTFSENDNLRALEDAAGEAKRLLGRDDYKVGVLLPILITSPTTTDFGDVDGDGRSENCSVPEDRMKVLKWWTELLISSFIRCGFRHIRLLGFYWYDESVPYDDNDYHLILSRYTGYIHSLGYKLVWEPWNQAPGISNWRDYGFDFVSMQPNYMWEPDMTVSSLRLSVSVSKLIGAGVQLEIHPLSVEDTGYLKKYRDYLRECNDAGCSQTVNSFYQSVAPGEFYRSYLSVDPCFRSVYDDTYLYVKGKLRKRGLKIRRTCFCAEANAPFRAKLAVNANNSAAAFILESDSAHGRTELMRDGSFIYCPTRGFSGIDSFTVTVSTSAELITERIHINVI